MTLKIGELLLTANSPKFGLDKIWTVKWCDYQETLTLQK